jgi:hypothetical protein
MPKKKDKDDETDACYVRLNSILDLARNSCDFTGAVRPIHAIKEGKEYTLFSIGERVSDTRMLYYCKSNEIGKFCVYNPNEEPKERMEMKDEISSESSDIRLYKIPVVELLKNPYKIKKTAKLEATLVQVKDFSSLIKALINDNAGEEAGAPKVYGFFSKGEHFIGSYEMFHEGSSKFFAYAKVDRKDVFNSIGYNYANGVVEVMDSFSSKSHMYVRVVNLAEPFPFFKP